MVFIVLVWSGMQIYKMKRKSQKEMHQRTIDFIEKSVNPFEK